MDNNYTSMHGVMEERKGTEITEITDDSDITSHDEQKKKSCCSGRCVLQFILDNLLLLLLITSLGVGIGMGAGMRAVDPPLDEREQMYFRFPGDLLMRMLKCIIIPLIVSSLISGVAGLGATASGRIGVAAIIYYLVTTFVAVLLGILLVCTIQPGFRANQNATVTGDVDEGNIVDSFLDLIRRRLIKYRSKLPILLHVTQLIQLNATILTLYLTVETLKQLRISVGPGMMLCSLTVDRDCLRSVYDFDIRKEDSMNVLGLVVYSLAMGIALSVLGDVGRPLYHVSVAVSEATMILVSVILWYSPIGISFLIASEIIAMEDPLAELESLGWYMMTVILGLTIHGLIILPAIYLVIVRRNPYSYLLRTLQALVTAFGTASSSSTLPVTYKCLEENNKIDRRVTRFILPIGATINMDGTALYEAVAAIYIAQTNGIHLNAAEIVATSITATLASIGAASVPQAGLVTMVIVLSAIGLPADEVTKILAVDWLLDRFRTMVNVEGDSIGAGVIARICRKELQQQQEQESEEDEDDSGMTSSDIDKIPLSLSASSEPSSRNSDGITTMEKHEPPTELSRF